jgi:hypothetical protein
VNFVPLGASTPWVIELVARRDHGGQFVEHGVQLGLGVWQVDDAKAPEIIGGAINADYLWPNAFPAPPYRAIVIMMLQRKHHAT